MTEIRMSLFSKIDQIGVIMRDLEKAARIYEKVLKQEPLPPTSTLKKF